VTGTEGVGLRVAVVGGGVTGLTAAYDAARVGHGVVLVDAADRVGGIVRTTPFAGHPVDCAADAFLARVPDAVGLCRELGLGDQLVSPAARQAHLLVRGDLHPFPPGLVLGVPTDLDALRRSALLSEAGVRRAAEDLDRPGAPLDHDVSVGALVRDRLGDEVFETLVAPLLSGVNGGDADRLSLDAGAPQLAVAARDGGSLIAALRRRAADADPSAPVFHGLTTGTETLTEALRSAALAQGAEVRLGATATAVSRTADGGWRIATAAGPLEADAVVLATPTYVTAALVAPVDAGVADALAALEYAPAVMVAVAVPRAGLGRQLDGSGFLVPEGEGLLMTACSWASSKWAHLDDPDVAILRVGAGRHHDRRADDLDDDELVAALLDDLTPVMGLTASPVEVRVSRWARALPQFHPGHLDRVATWRAALAERAPGLHLAGAGYDGLGLPACIRQARSAVAALTTEATGPGR
jgi:protoporphyrinogen/coproporphyrinogen III oxidase